MEESNNQIYENSPHESTCVSSSNVSYGCESWAQKKDDEARINAYEMRCLRQVFRILWTTKKTNEWVHKTAGVKISPFETIKQHKWHTTDTYWEEMGVPRERFNAKDNTRPPCTRQTKDNMDGQHEGLDWLDGRWTDEKGRGQSTAENHCSWRGQPSCRGWLKTRQVIGHCCFLAPEIWAQRDVPWSARYIMAGFDFL